MTPASGAQWCLCMKIIAMMSDKCYSGTLKWHLEYDGLELKDLGKVLQSIYVPVF